MTTKQLISECKKHIKTLNSLKALANKYDNTDLVLTDAEWTKIKLHGIDSRDWLRHDMTSNQWYNEMIDSTRIIIENN